MNEKKVWGATRVVEQNRHYSRHELELVAGGYCSVHYHHERANNFRVLRGRVRIIRLWGWVSEAMILTQDNELVIPSLVVHQFQVLESGMMVEEYFSDRGGAVHNCDIFRLSEGGMADPAVMERYDGVILSPEELTSADITRYGFVQRAAVGKADVRPQGGL